VWVDGLVGLETEVSLWGGEDDAEPLLAAGKATMTLARLGNSW
jgi:hypothetical protein